MKRIALGLTIVAQLSACHWPIRQHRADTGLGPTDATDSYVDAFVLGDGPQPFGDSTLPCDPVGNSGCGGDASCRATVVGGALTVACGASGTQQLWESCTGNSDCVPRTHCLTYPNQDAGFCMQLCYASAGTGECGSHSACVAPIPFLGPFSNVRACTISNGCEYLPGDTCDAGSQCYPSNAAGMNRCRNPAGGADGVRCCDPWQCSPGSVCVASSSPGDSGCGTGGGFCRRLCLGDAGCAGSCQPVSGYPTDYRACIP